MIYRSYTPAKEASSTGTWIYFIYYNFTVKFIVFDGFALQGLWYHVAVTLLEGNTLLS